MLENVWKHRVATNVNRFVDTEAWRKETQLDETVPTWEYPEKEQIFKFYPQYYHKTDKVGFLVALDSVPFTYKPPCIGWPTCLHRKAGRD